MMGYTLSSDETSLQRNILVIASLNQNPKWGPINESNSVKYLRGFELEV